MRLCEFTLIKENLQTGIDYIEVLHYDVSIIYLFIYLFAYHET